MAYGILLIRLVLGLTMAAHGAQKLFGWFGGPGPTATAAFFGNLRFRAPLAMAVAAALAELAGGLLALGLLTPVAVFAICVVMLNAVATVHWRKGFWNSAGGFELNLLILATAVAVAMTGPGRFSVDAAIGWDDRISGLWWGVGVLVAAVLASAATLSARRAAADGAASTSAEEERPDIRRAA